MMMNKLIFFVLLISYEATAMASEAVSHISSGNAKFSNKLYDILARDDGNVLYSPISVHAILSLLYQGAAAGTSQSLGNALYLSDTKTAAEGYQNLMQKLNSVENVKLDIANKVFVHQTAKLKDAFNAVAKDYFLSEIQNVNFAQSDAAAKLINDWVENKTNNRIKDLISSDDLNGMTRLVLVNAIYFKGDWLHKFDVVHTKKQTFYLSENDNVECEMMKLWSQEFRYGVDDELDAQVISLPYTNENLSLMIFLPKSRTGIKDLEKKLSTKSLSTINQNLYSAEVNLSLPKFKIETTMDLKDPLSELGMGVMFNNSADFSNMLDSVEKLQVSKVVQKAFIEVNEEGAEAAAATGVQIVAFSLAPQPHVFKADHPFHFVLTYNQNDAVIPLFVGRFSRP